MLRHAAETLGADRVWANPDCGLKTRGYDEVVPALRHLVAAARRVRDEAKPPHIADDVQLEEWALCWVSEARGE